MTIHEIRLANAELIIQQRFKGNKSKFARSIGKQPPYVSTWWAKNERSKRNIGSTTARLIEDSLGLPRGWMDIPHKEYELESDQAKKAKQQISAGDTHTIQLLDRCTIDNDMALTLLNTNIKGELMLLSTDKDAYALEFIGHHSNPILSNGWGIVVEPNTPLTEGEYAFIKLANGQQLLRIVTFADDNLIVAMNPLDKQQNSLPRSQIASAEYCYIGIPPSKIIRSDQE